MQLGGAFILNSEVKGKEENDDSIDEDRFSVDWHWP